VRKSYGSQVAVAVAGVTLEVPPATCFGLLGPNGAGKSTLISILAGTLAPDEGSVHLGGALFGVQTFEQKRRLGYVPQELALYEELSARDNLRFIGSVFELPPSQLKDRIDFALSAAGLESRGDDLVKNFSGGMKRRLNIVGALMHSPELLILDEPTVGVDPQSRNLIFETLEGLIAQGMTLIYTTHYMEEVERLCQRVAIMDHGRIVAEGDINDLHRLVPGNQVVHLQLRERPTFSFASLPVGVSPHYEHPYLSVQLDDLSADLPPLIEWLVRQGACIENVRSERPSLEQVFLHLTGRTLRD